MEETETAVAVYWRLAKRMSSISELKYERFGCLARATVKCGTHCVVI